MIDTKNKVTEDVREEKQSYRKCEKGKAKLQRVIERKSKVTEEVGKEKQRSRGC